MIDFWEAIHRSETGELLEERKYDRLLGQKTKEIINKYQIKYNSDQVIPSDNAFIDRIYEAALELFVNVGVYSADTGRVMKFTKEEVLWAVERAVDHIVWGEGRDQRVMVPRRPEDSKPPFCNFSLVGTPYPEELFLKACISTAQEPLADTFSGPSLLHTLRGFEVRSGSPMEVEAAIWDIGKRREAAQCAGFPGKGIYTMVSCAEKADAMIAAARPEFGALARDGILCAAIAELKVDNDRMKKAVFLRRASYSVGGLFGPLMGGYAGGPEGTSLILIAHHFLGRLVFETEYSVCFPVDIHQVCNTTRQMLWLVSTAHQALARNTHLLHFANTFIAAGPCTEMACYELIAHGITASVSGANLSPAASARNKYPECCTGMEGRICAEAAHAATKMGLTRSDANRFVKEILQRYEKDIQNAPIGKKFSECYDLETVKPNKEYVELYQKIKEEMRKIGLVYTH